MPHIGTDKLNSNKSKEIRSDKYELFNSVSYWCSNNFNNITICKGDVNNGKRFKSNNWFIHKMGKGKRRERFFR